MRLHDYMYVYDDNGNDDEMVITIIEMILAISLIMTMMMIRLLLPVKVNHTLVNARY